MRLRVILRGSTVSTSGLAHGLDRPPAGDGKCLRMADTSLYSETAVKVTAVACNRYLWKASSVKEKGRGAAKEGLRNMQSHGMAVAAIELSPNSNTGRFIEAVRTDTQLLDRSSAGGLHCDCRKLGSKVQSCNEAVQHWSVCKCSLLASETRITLRPGRGPSNCATQTTLRCFSLAL